MKLNIKHLLVAMLAAGAPVMLSSCSEKDYFDVDINGVPEAANYQDNVVVTVDQSTNTATFTFTGTGVYPVWILDGKSYSSTPTFSKYYRKAGDYSVECKIGNGNGISAGTITKTFHIDKTMMTGFAGYVYDSDYNMWKKQSHEKGDVSFYYAPNWSQLPDPDFSFNGDELVLNLPSATFDRWQAQMHVQSHISAPAGENYDGSLIMTSNVDLKGVTVKIHPNGDDEHAFYPSEKGNKQDVGAIDLMGGEPKAFFFTNLPAEVDMNDMVWTFDFGGCPDNVEVIIENIVFKKHSDDDGTVVPEVPSDDQGGNGEEEPVWVAYDSADNLFYGVEVTPWFYYAPNWAQLPDPGFVDNGDGSYTITFPEATFDRWQAQTALKTLIQIPDANVEYDFCCKIEVSSPIKPMFKLTDLNSDDNFFFAEEEQVDGVKKFWRTKVKPAVGPMEGVSMFFDFGGNEAGLEVTISNIILQVHKE